ncbi:amino acid--[acyl-carrier-protein] ligase [Methylobacterium nonmethylotrophicum]|uniref:Amino acid--[acyl-carrier-protein] ligase n=1 Tax=Methylobacterium nonmethylotrophicum TaxID=1141884 RepID=A0A4Z0NRD7_9HYPH|nr:amino acid--[acyl-carrier-protein] ligase [Methylobacterium nonmethylotrophicum]TGD99419.1 amino acid--[acyl-carrier-protein] ligase [Methylobacterium nonmethylotrophicum]
MNMQVVNLPSQPKGTDPLDALFDAMFRPMAAQGVYARTGAYEAVVEGLAALISRLREDGTEVFRFPPVMSRAHLERHGYLNSFPNLLGCVSCLEGTDAQIMAMAARQATGGDWTEGLRTADLVLTPAACYPVYPIAAARGPVPEAGYRFDVACDCFRREPSQHLDRLQSFRMREYVTIGTPEQVAAFRERWIGRATALADTLGLPYRVEQASDPFFGRVGQVMAMAQLQQALKFELLVPLRGEGSGTACMSFNYHREHFGTTWDLRCADGEFAHTGCVAFGMDRLAVALFATHGPETADWPGSVRAALSL